MKIHHLIIILIILSITLNIINYNYFLILLSITWYIATILLIYSSVISSIRYKFIQLNIKKIFKSLLSKSKNNITPLSSLCLSLASKIGVGSLSGIALAIYYGGIGTIFWICIISLLIAINTYIESILGIKYREKINNTFVGGPSYYIKKCLNNSKLSTIYSILIIITYSILFLSIQTNTIITTTNYHHVNSISVIIIIVILTLLITIKGIYGVSKVNSIIVPIMIILYALIGLYITINNYQILPSIVLRTIKEAFRLKSIIPTFIIGMQRAIFVTESSVGSSAISASSCDNTPDNQGLLEVLGIYIIIFIIALTTFLIVTTSNYQQITFNNINGIEIILYSFKYHFGLLGTILLSCITILFAFSTLISSYYFGESNILLLSKNKIINIIYKIVFLLIIIISSYIKPKILWNLTDYFIALLVIINTYAIIKVYNLNFYSQ